MVELLKMLTNSLSISKPYKSVCKMTYNLLIKSSSRSVMSADNSSFHNNHRAVLPLINYFNPQVFNCSPIELPLPYSTSNIPFIFLINL